MNSDNDNLYKNEPGVHNVIIENILFNIIKSFSVPSITDYTINNFRIIGSTVLFLAKKLNFINIDKNIKYDHNYKYIQSIDENKNIKNRQIDIVVLNSYSYNIFKNILSSYGKISFSNITNNESIFGISINKDVKFVERIELIINEKYDFSKKELFGNDKIFSSYIYDLVGEIKIIFNIICINNSWKCMKKWIVPTLSKNFYFEYSNDNANFGEITDYDEINKPLNMKCSILSMIKTLENINYLYEYNGYTNSGDKICLSKIPKEEESKFYNEKYKLLNMKKKYGFNIGINERIKYVLENNDINICSFLKVKCIYSKYVNEKLLLSKFKFSKTISKRIVSDIKSGIECSICFDKIQQENVPVYITKCSHIFHVNCISKGISQTYYDYYNAMKDKLENLIEYDIFGNLIKGHFFNCPNCRKDLFGIKLNYNNILDTVFDDTYSDFVISKNKFKTKTIFDY
jgi:hypothetical protein